MSNKVQIRRGTFAQLAGITPDAGEPCWTTDTKGLYLGDGSTIGGIKIGGSPIITAFTVYVATTAYGGTATGSGLTLKSGTNTGVAVNKLIDSGGGFNSTHLNKTVYNVPGDKWAKITNIDSSTQVTLSADIFLGTPNSYVICDANSTIEGGFGKIENPFWANVTLRISDGTFSDNVTFDGKIPAGNYGITVQCCSATGATTISGTFIIRQKCAIQGLSGTNLVITGKINTRGNADIAWDYVNASNKTYIYDNAINLIKNSTFTFGNDPKNVTSINSTITKGYTYYVATTALGGSDTTGDGLEMYTGSATSTTANKLVDSAANFGTDAVNKTVYNSTDDTWAKVTARDSATQLSLSADIMASSEAYVISNAFATIQKGIDAIPGMVNSTTTIGVSNGTFPESLILFGKNFSGNYSIIVQGTRTYQDSGTASSGGDITLTDSTKAWGVNAHAERFVITTGGTGSGQVRLIKSNTGTQLTVYQKWATNPDVTTIYKIVTLGTNGMSVTTKNAQKSISFRYLNIDKTDAVNVWVQSNASIGLIACHATAGTDSVLRGETGAMITTNQMVAYSGPRCLLQGFASFTANGTVIRNMSGYGLHALDLSWVYLFEGNEIRNNTNTGVQMETNCSMFNIPDNTAGRQNTFSNNGGWGVYVDSGSQASGLASGSFSGNTSGTYGANAAKFAYAA